MSVSGCNSAFYTMHLAKHLPARRQLPLYLQLHNLVAFFPSMKTLELCYFIKLYKLALEVYVSFNAFSLNIYLNL